MSCQIVLHNPSSFYFPGYVIEGKVICVFNKTKDIRGIKVKIRGKERTRWSEEEFGKDVDYTGNNTFFWHQINFVGEGPIDPGTYEYPFQFVLPNVCPSNFKNFYGMVWYYLQATVDIPWAIDYDHNIDLTVVAPVDLNTVPNINLSSTHYQDEKFLCCCCCASRPISMDVYLDKEAYVMGEAIRFKVHLSNMSSNTIGALNIQLVMITTSIATHPIKKTKKQEKRITALYETGVGPHATRDYDLSLGIPSDYIIPNFSTCTLFQNWYGLKVIAEISGHIDLQVPATVILGHVPLIGAGNGVFVHANQFAEPSQTGFPFTHHSPSENTTHPQYSAPLNKQELAGVHMSLPQYYEENKSTFPSSSYPSESGVHDYTILKGSVESSVNENNTKNPQQNGFVDTSSSNEIISNKPQDDVIEKTPYSKE